MPASRLVSPAVLLLILLAGTVAAALSAGEPSDPDPWVPVGFVVIRSTTDYAEALRLAEGASSQLGIKLNLRGVVYDPAFGLTLSKQECEKASLAPYPCYVARGRFDAGTYLSVERSDSYESFRPGYFVVVAASGEPGATELSSALESARQRFPDAYMKVAKVYHGCMH